MNYKPGDIILVPTIAEYECVFANDDFAAFKMLSFNHSYDNTFGYAGRIYKQNDPQSPKVKSNESSVV